MTQRHLIWIAVGILVWDLLWATGALCWDCGGPCGDSLDCPSACVCTFPEDDDNHHYGRCS